MQFRRKMTTFFGLMAVLIGAGATASCGSSFSDAEEPELTIEGAQGINLNLPNDADRPRTQPAIEVRNSGGSDLVVTNVELINTPSRLQFLAERGGTCASDADCDGGICFPDTSVCAQLGSPETPYTVAPRTRRDLELVITKGPRELACAEAPEGTPTEFTSDYCGELRIETRAINSNGFIEDGSATLYFLAPRGSGQISVNPSFIQFNEVTNNYSETKSFNVSNDGQQPLTIRGISTEDRSNLFEISPANFPLEIAPGTVEIFELKLEIGSDEVELNFNTDLIIDSSAATVPPFSIRVSTEAEPGPRISVDPETLEFSQEATRDLTISNVGMTTLTISSLSVQPVGVRDFYTFESEGAPFQSLAVPAGDSKTIQVTFNRPDGNIEDAVGQLQIGHNDTSSGNRTTVTLLGDAGEVPLGDVLPPTMTFLATTGQTDSREFVIRNIGAGPLTITGVDLNFSAGEESEFVVDGAIGTIQPGEFTTATLSFTATNDTPDTGEAVFVSDSEGPDLVLPIVSNNTNDTVTPVIVPNFSGELRPGAIATFSSAGTMPGTASRTWVLLSRPAGSQAFAYRVGNSFAVRADVAGEYEIGMTARAGSREAQTTTTFSVTE